jgi:outer membrane protein TolC
VGVRQTIFDFAKTGSQVDAADARTTLAEDSRLMLQRDLAFATAQDFYAILFLRRSVDVQDEEIRTLLEHQDNAHKRYEGGTATQLDELTTQVRVAGAQTGRINLVDQLRTQEIAFRALADLPGTDTLALAGDFAPPSGVSDPDSLRTVALATRIEAKALRDMVTSAQLQQRAARLTDAPSLNASFAYGVKNGFIPNLDVWRGNFTLAVGLMYPILDGGRTSGMEEEAFATLQATEAKQRETDIAISSDVARANAAVAAALEKIGVSETNIRQAELAVKTARLRYDAGTVSNLDLLDAETDLSQAKLNHLQALYDGVMSNLQRRRALGLSATE